MGVRVNPTLLCLITEPVRQFRWSGEVRNAKDASASGQGGVMSKRTAIFESEQNLMAPQAGKPLPVIASRE
jgi:hypothetical protein